MQPTTIDITPKINITETNIHKIVTFDKKLVIKENDKYYWFEHSWYDEKGLELWREVEGALMCYCRGIGLIILGFIALVTLIASSITAALSLAQSVQTATFVDNLAQNVSVTLGTQEDIDKKLED